MSMLSLQHPNPELSEFGQDLVEKRGRFFYCILTSADFRTIAGQWRNPPLARIFAFPIASRSSSNPAKQRSTTSACELSVNRAGNYMGGSIAGLCGVEK